MQNGSGLYDSNRFSAEQIVTILRAASRDFRISAEFLASLAVAGTDGTIAHRMGGTLAERYVRAKTGTLANVELPVWIRRLTRPHAARVLDHRERHRQRDRCAPRAGSRGGDPRRLLGGRRETRSR